MCMSPLCACISEIDSNMLIGMFSCVTVEYLIYRDCRILRPTILTAKMVA